MNNTAEKKDLFYIVVLILTLIAVIIGITFATYYFLHRQKEGSSSVYTGTLLIEYKSGNTIKGNYLIPREEPNYEDTENVYVNNFSVTNNGTLDSILRVNLDLGENDFTENILMYKLFNSEQNLLIKGRITSNGAITIIDNIELPSMKSEDFRLLIWLNETGVEQNEDMKKSLTGAIAVEANQKID